MQRNFLKHLISKAWILFSESASRASVSQPEEDGVDKKLGQLELVCEADEVLCQILFNLAIAAIAEAILMRISAEKVAYLHRVAPRYLKLITSSNFWPFTLISVHDKQHQCRY